MKLLLLFIYFYFLLLLVSPSGFSVENHVQKHFKDLSRATEDKFWQYLYNYRIPTIHRIGESVVYPHQPRQDTSYEEYQNRVSLNGVSPLHAFPKFFRGFSHNYTSMVFTGCVDGAGTNANNILVFAGLNTENKTEIHEVELQTDTSKSEKCQVDTYRVRYHLRRLRFWSMYVRTDARGAGSEWYLESVFIYDDQEAEYFFYSDWVPEDHLSHLIPDIQSLNSTNYRIWIYTHNQNKAGTDSNIWLRICHGNDHCIWTTKALNKLSSANVFEQNELNGFLYNRMKSVGEIEYIMLKSDGAHWGSDWAPGVIAINDDKAKMYYEFDGLDWLIAVAQSRRQQGCAIGYNIQNDSVRPSRCPAS